MSLKKILTVASSEFATAVKSKAFIIGIVMLPVFMGGGVAVEALTKDRKDVSDRRVVLIDRTGGLEALVMAAAAERNGAVFGPEGRQLEPKFLPMFEAPAAEESPEATDLRLSERVRTNELFAFAVIPADVFTARAAVHYHSNTPTYRDLADWLEATLNREHRRRVIAEAAIAPQVVAKLDRKIGVAALGLAERSASGQIESAKAVSVFRTFVIPIIIMMLLFMTTMSAAPQLLNAVLEEKQLRIAEFLVSAVTPFDLMAGKLLGTVGVAGLLSALYMGGGIGVAAYYKSIDLVPFELLPWFFAFLVLATLIYGSIFISIGAACSDLKDAQSMMSPAMLLVMMPVFVWSVIVKEPNGPLATGLSLFPLFSPVLMPLRIAVPPGPPAWQPFAAFGITLLVTSFFVWCAGRIFRVGVLMQGKSPSFAEMVRWIRTK